MSSKREHEPSSTPDPLGKRLKESPKLFENESAPSSLPIETQNHQNQVPSAVKPNSISKTTDTCLIQKPNATNSDSFTSSFPVISEQESESNDKTKHVKDETLKVEISKSNSTLKPYLTEVEVGVSEDKGTRHSMEDAWVMMEDYYVSESSKPVSNHSRFSFYAIFDGHGGRKAAIFAKNNMHKFVFKNNLSYEKVEHKKFRKEIVDGIKNLDSALLKESAAENWQDGAAIVCVWIIKQSVFIANLGDAKAILAKESNEQEKKNIKEKEKENEKEVEIGIEKEIEKEKESNKKKENAIKALTITREHKAIFPLERSRIEKCGGHISSNGRVEGKLEVSRALGDRTLKKYGVSAMADVQSFDFSGREKFLILACDGLWGVFSPQDAVDFVNKQLNDGANIQTCCRKLVKEAIVERKCHDNCTVMCFKFKHYFH